MIRLSPASKIIYTMVNRNIALLLILMTTVLLSHLQSLPIQTLVSDIPIPFDVLSVRIYDALIVSGLVIGGLVMCMDSLPVTPLRWAFRLWQVNIIISLATSSAVLSIGIIIFIMLMVTACQSSPFLRVWQLGMLLVVLLLPLRAWFAHVTTDYLLTHIAYGVSLVGITFWLMTRWSHVRIEWAHDGVWIVSGVVALAGALVSFAPLAVGSIKLVMGIIILPCYMILAGHHYRALRDRTHDMSLSPHWVAMATVMWLGAGFIGVVAVVVGTHLMHVQLTFIRWVAIMINLSMVNYVITHLHGQNKRVTGYIPLWLIGFGVGLVGIATLCQAIIEIYLRSLLQLATHQVDMLLLPMTIAVVICWFVVVAGVIIYALGYIARRPKIII